VAFSGGKDSLCVLALVREQSPQTPAVYFDAGCAFPECLALLDETPRLTRFKTDEPLLTTLARLGLHHSRLEQETMQTTVYGPVKRLIAEYGFDGVAYGLRAEESPPRRRHALRRGGVFQYQRDSLWACQPAWDWSYFDVWAFILTRNLRYCATYDRMWSELPPREQRLSYWAGESARERGRFLFLKRHYPELWALLCKALPEASTYA
jgi:3'-phosphoadenosine 5'-phosphosulfate sulfotransferase (PAPS reductase)/FAD synthetase